MLERKLYGCVVPIVTPLDEAQRVDTESLEHLTDFLIEKEIPCLYPNGTTGEMLMFSVADRKLVAETVVKRSAGKARVYVQTGAMSLEDTVELSRHAAEIGADGIGVVTPSYFKMEDDAIVAFYQKVAKSVPADFPIYLYGIPQCSVNDINVSVAERVADTCPNVIGIKYSYPNMSRMLEMMGIRENRFSVLCGPDELYHVLMCGGGDGTVSGNAQVIPEHYVAIGKAIAAGDMEKARLIQRRTTMLNNILCARNNISCYKVVLKHMGIISCTAMKEPLMGVDETYAKKLIDTLEKNQFREVIL
ncbi:MAG: dihydrodipicolinate synthase family protein [Lachnospiraceae bacterium]|nr:dihydrodipicolinate synthase family protein [Lachnospiraceae bacterium]